MRIRDKYTIVVDFDGTCVKHIFPRIGEDVPGAVDVLKELIEAGHKLVLFTMRCDNHPERVLDTGYKIHSGDFLTPAVQWFNRKGIPLHGVQRNPIQDEWTTSPKAYGQIYIDDAALGCPLVHSPDPHERPYVDWVAVRQLLIERGVL